MRMNKVCLAGHLGVDPKLLHLPSGTAVVEFTLATDESYRDREGNKVSRTEWHRIKIYGRAGEFAFSHIYKGHHVYIEGSLRTRSWEDKETGRKRYLTEVVVSGPRDCIQLLERREPKQADPAQGDRQDQSPPSPSEEMAPPAPDEEVPTGYDDVPF